MFLTLGGFRKRGQARPFLGETPSAARTFVPNFCGCCVSVCVRVRGGEGCPLSSGPPAPAAEGLAPQSAGLQGVPQTACKQTPGQSCSQAPQTPPLTVHPAPFLSSQAALSKGGEKPEGPSWSPRRHRCSRRPRALRP